MKNFFNFRHFFRVIFRNAKLTWINIIGLSVGLAVSMFLLVYLEFEFSYDKHFKDADRIYRMLSIWDENKKEVMPICLEGLASSLMKEIPEVEVCARLYRNGGASVVRREGGENMNVKSYEVDSSFLKIFSFHPISGQIESALSLPGNCVITRNTAERIFGKEIDPLGQPLIAENGRWVLKVAAVIENIPANTHFYFDILTLLPEYNFGGLEYFTYLKFRPGTDIPQAIDKCNALNQTMLDKRFKSNSNAQFSSITEPLTGIHVSSRADFDLSMTASKANLIFIIMVILLVLGVALSNFIALSIIQGEKRAREISVRKTNGASRVQMVKMLFAETFGITLLAFILALILYYGFSETFARILNFNLPGNIGITGKMWGMFLGLFAVVTLIAGGYPAYYLSVFNPADLIRKSEIRKYRLTTASVVVQFSVVIFCISALFIIWRQLDYVRKLPLGFQPENVLEVFVNCRLSEYEGLRSELLQYPCITKVAMGQGDPIASGSGQGIRRSDQTPQEASRVNEHRVGPGYMDLFEIPILEGRNFSTSMQGEEQNVILSETMVAALGLKEPVGKKVYISNYLSATVIGVAKDVLQSAHGGFDNWMYTAYAKSFFMMAVKFAPGKYAEAKETLNKVLSERYKNIPIAMVLTTDLIRQNYIQDEITSRILFSGTILAIFLALLGLLALSSFVAWQKKKEISVRRVAGAQVGEIVYALNYYIILRILPAIPIGIALSYYAMSRWLQNFEYARSLDVWVFLLAIAITLGIVLLTILYQTLKAAHANPAETLRSE